MDYIERARALRPIIEEAAAGLGDETALQAIELFPAWDDAAVYEADIRVRYEGVLYRCLQAHTAQTDWNPAEASSLWAKVLIDPSGKILPWEQPDSTNPYQIGDKVTHVGKTWESTVANNVWEPGVYGWKEV